MIYSISFSPTGSTMRAARLIACAVNKESVFIDLTDSAYDFSSVAITPDDISIISVPAFGGRVPVPAADRLKRINGNGSRAILLVTYGTRGIDDTLLELGDISKECGFRIIAAIEAVTEHSLIRDYGEGRPNHEDKKLLRTFAYQIFNNLDKLTEPSLPGNRPYKVFPGSAAKPTSSARCIACGLCSRYCPVNAIPMDDLRSVDKSRCITCMRCVTLCPAGSRSYPTDVRETIDKMLAAKTNKDAQNKLYISY